VPGQPRELSVLGSRLVVTGAQSTDLAIVDTTKTGADAVVAVPIPCGGSRSVATLPGSAGTADRAVVTCPTDDRLVVVDLDREEAIGTVALAGRPTGIVRDGDVVTVSTALDGKLHAFDASDLRAAGTSSGSSDEMPALHVAARSSRTVWADGDRTPSTLASLDTGPRGPLGTYQVVDNRRKLPRAQIEAGSTYGSPTDGRARLEPAIAGACGARFSSLTDEPRRLSGPVALAAAPGSDLVWVVGEFSHSVSVVRCDGSASGRTSTTVAAFDVGEGARGIVLSEDGTRAYVDVGFDHEVAELRLPDGAADVGPDDPIERVEPAKVGRRKVHDRYLSPLAQEGRRMFNDATNTHLTPFGVVTCGSCHPSAGEDGLSWRIESADPETKAIERKVRRTPPAWQVDPSVKPLHWDGEFTSTDDLTLTTIQQLLGGDGLLVDTAAISAYLEEVAAPPTRPTGDREQTALDRLAGQRALVAAGCTTCHLGDAGTDGKAHDVLSPSDAPDGDLPAVITPPLRAVRGRAPYGHDGRAPDLTALLAQHGDGTGATIQLSPDELAAVIAYLDTR
jgi:mono/diheme cytochrome c family protein